MLSGFPKEYMAGINWGIIGPGVIAREFVNDLPLVANDQSIAAVMGRRESSTAKEFAKDYQVKSLYTSIDEFIEKGKPDAVYIATPHPLHYEEAKQCLQHKVPVLCEKPLCINAEQCRELISIAKENNTFLMEAMWLRFLPFIEKAYELLIQEKMLGDILTIYASMNYKAPPDPDSRYFKPDLGGGSLLDLGVYPVFLSVLLLGMPDNIKAIATLTEQGVDEICSAVLKYNNGAHAVIESSLIKNSDAPAVISGTKGTLKILYPWFERSPGLEIQLQSSGKYNYAFSWRGHGLHFEIKEMLNCLQEGKTESEKMSHQFSLNMATITDEIREQTGVKYEMFE